MKVSASIMAHPLRRSSAERVAASLGRDVPVIYDDNPVPSADPQQRWATGARAWQAYDPAADWHLVLQDDAVPSKDLLEALEGALENLGDSGVLSCYTGRGRPHASKVSRMLSRALQEGWSWMPMPDLLWGVVVAVPVHTIEHMLRWCSKPQVANHKYDARLNAYYRDVRRWRTWYTIPSLVDHSDEPSLVGHDTIARTAHEPYRGSALDIDFSRVPPGGLQVSRNGWRFPS